MADEATPPAGQAPAPDGTPAPAAPPAEAPKPFANRYAKPVAKPAPQAQAATATTAEPPKPAALKIPGRIAKELEQHRAQAASYKTTTKALEATQAALGEYAKRELDGLSEAQRGYVLKHAGKDPVRQLAMAADLRAMAPAAAPPPPKPLANNGPGAKAPTPDNADPDSIALAKLEELESKGAKLAAAMFAKVNHDAIKRARAARTAN